MPRDLRRLLDEPSTPIETILAALCARAAAPRSARTPSR